MSKWVRLKKYCELTGETESSVRLKREQGHWAEGFHYKKLAADSRIWIHTERVDQWVENESGLSE
ncbi:excisionase [Motiliproteus coralliicola]|uniref:Excisionase n=1 Tax=Motiliproteus coralliicola TaxID=2283196 RepID=A0A369WUA0_9GAMM|nr:excisionase [Motiliproteus coralliicola]